MDESKDKHSAVSIAPKLMASANFDSLYREGMDLIEQVAAYLDGPGREESQTLPRDASFVYATESMRLTTRLMQLASWLLLQKAVNEGEISAENARSEKEKVQFSATPSERGGPGWDALPETLRDYLLKGDRLFARVSQFHELERGGIKERSGSVTNDIADQMARLSAAFPKAGRQG